MIKTFILLAITFVFIAQSAFCQVHVNGYYKKNGTYVEPHYRSSPDKSIYNNYSYPGNTNPYTGKSAKGNQYQNVVPYSNSSSLPYYYSNVQRKRKNVGKIIVFSLVVVAACVGVAYVTAY